MARIMVKRLKDSEQGYFEADDFDLGNSQTAWEDEGPETGATFSGHEFELGESSLDLYLGEVAHTPLLTAEEEKLLGSQIEEGKHLRLIEQNWLSEHGVQPSAIDLLVVLVERLSQADWLFEILCQHLQLPAKGGLASKMTHPELRRAIDGHIDEHLSSVIAQIAEKSQTEIEQSLVQFSLDSRILPWHVMNKVKECNSLSELKELIETTEFHRELEKHSSEIAQHFENVRRKAQEATERMIQSNLRLVISVAKDHSNRGVPISDLIQEGNIGLMQAVQKFDHRRGYKFSTYAIPWIWQAINRAINDQARIIRLPGHLVDAVTKLGRAKNSLSQKLGRQPTEKELASEMGLPLHKIEWLLELSSGKPVSFETPIGEEGDELGDFISDRTAVEPEEEASASLLKEQLSEVLDSLTPRERRVIELRFGLDNEYSRTLEEVGAEMGLTKERIRQIEKEALAKLRHPSLSRRLIDYLG